MKNAIEQLTEAARKGRKVTGERYTTASLEVTCHDYGNEQTEVKFSIYCAATGSISGGTLEEAIENISRGFGPAAMVHKAERMEQEAASLREAAAKMEGKQ